MDDERREQDEGRMVEVPGYYTKLYEPGTYYKFDSTPAAWLWKAILDHRDETLIEAAAIIIEAHSDLGSYSPTGEDFYLVAPLMCAAGWGSAFDEEDMQRFLAANRAKIERRVREIRAQREEGDK